MYCLKYVIIIIVVIRKIIFQRIFFAWNIERLDLMQNNAIIHLPAKSTFLHASGEYFAEIALQDYEHAV